MTTTEPSHQVRLAEILQQASIQMIIAGGDGDRFLEWAIQTEEGKATSPGFRTWIEHQIDFEGEKDRPYANYLRSLIA